MQFIRSLIFSVGMIIATVMISLVLLLFAPLPFSLRSRAARVYAAYVIGSLKILCGVDYQVKGRENIPQGAAIIFSKHQSTWETYALQLMFPPQVWVLKRELMWLPFFGWGMAMLKPISIDRSSGRKAIKQIIEQGKARLDAGIWVTVFPEGTRIAPGQHKRWGMGGAILAEESGCPIVPVAHNAGEFWPRRVFVKQPGTIQVVIGPVIEARGRKATEINAEAETWMRATMTEISSIEKKAAEAASAK
jgi:1-acyl-sn-glycerol-3-phosphate acyltransferase